jgi:CubicO group peptidase (beta-lactamase class C family)
MAHFENKVAQLNISESTKIPEVDGFYYYEKEASAIPAYHFRLSAHDLALFVQLYLNHGSWNGKQIISKEWIDISTQPYSITNEKYGLAYGMLRNVLTPEAQQGRTSFYHTGTGVHMLGIYPSLKLVMVHRVDTEQPYKFHEGNLYQIIRLMHGARVKQPGA